MALDDIVCLWAVIGLVICGIYIARHNASFVALLSGQEEISRRPNPRRSNPLHSNHPRSNPLRHGANVLRSLIQIQSEESRAREAILAEMVMADKKRNVGYRRPDGQDRPKLSYSRGE